MKEPLFTYPDYCGAAQALIFESICRNRCEVRLAVRGSQHEDLQIDFARSQQAAFGSRIQ